MSFFKNLRRINRLKQWNRDLRDRIAELELELERTQSKSVRRKRALREANRAIIRARYHSRIQPSIAIPARFPTFAPITKGLG